MQFEELTDASIIQILKDHNLDTTSHKYVMKAERYERYTRGKDYVSRCSCPGDYLAYFMMLLHKKSTAEALNEYFDDAEEFREFVADHPTVSDIDRYASQNWWGDGDDYIFYLKNLDTGEMLYQSEEDEIYEED